MSAADLSISPDLRAATRLERLVSAGGRVAAWEWGVLLVCGVGAAVASTFIDFNLRMPGHAILRVAFPMAAGLALVSRRGSGMVMAGSALTTAMLLRGFGYSGEGLSLGALTSLGATGPLLDLSLHTFSRRWGLYPAFAIGGLCANLLAFAVRGGAKCLGWEHTGAGGLAAWFAQAAWTYPLCGLLAGLACGVVWFSARPRRPDAAGPAT